MKLVLAPMEGVVDYKMRELLTDIGGFDLCVTEFIRVRRPDVSAPSVYPFAQSYLMRLYSCGHPVRIQLLGQVPHAWRQCQKSRQTGFTWH